MDSSEDENNRNLTKSNGEVIELKSTNEFCGFESITEFSKVRFLLTMYILHVTHVNKLIVLFFVNLEWNAANS